MRASFPIWLAGLRRSAAVVTATLVLVACGSAPAATPTPAGSSGGGGSQPTAAGSSQGAAVSQAAASEPAASVGGGTAITDPCKLISTDEAAAVLGTAITETSSAPAKATLDIWTGPLVGCGFRTAGQAYLAAAIVPNGKAQYDDAKAKGRGASPLAGVGDDAFIEDQSGGAGTGPFLVAALKGDTAIYLYSIGFPAAAAGAVFGAMQGLLKLAITRV